MNPIITVVEVKACDLAFLRKSLSEDDDLVRAIVRLFLTKHPSYIAGITDAIASCSPRDLEFAAHSFKSVLLTFGEKASIQAAQRLEDIGRGGGTDGAAPVLELLRAAVVPLIAAAHIHLAAGHPSLARRP